MRSVEVRARVTGRSAAEIYPILCDFERYPEHCDAVRSVTTDRREANRVISSWEVNFQRGILRWTEEDRFDPSALTIQFHQVEGDVDHFAGQWVLSDTDTGCAIYFQAGLDLGIPTLSDLLEPIAERALKENVCSILTGLLSEEPQFVTV